MKFYVGISQHSHLPWVRDCFMLSFQVIKRRKVAWVIPDHLEWIMDSGAFSELKKYGCYTFTPEEYFKYVEWWQPNYFVNMDWMCEPSQLRRTNHTTQEHQQKSLDNQIKLYELWEDSWIKPHCEFMGVLQGWMPKDYVEHIDLLKEHNMILPYMGIGSVCRRASDRQIVKVIKTIRKELPNTKLHGFGIKTTMLKNPVTYRCLNSVDSQAWSLTGWRKFNDEKRLLGTPCIIHPYKRCPKDTDDCANCGRFMSHWVEKNLKLIERNGYQQLIDSCL